MAPSSLGSHNYTERDANQYIVARSSNNIEGQRLHSEGINESNFTTD